MDGEGFDDQSSEDVRDGLLAALGDIKLSNAYQGSTKIAVAANSDDGNLDVPMYQIDGLVRRAEALQLTPEARRAAEKSSA